jgi:hypothetical protein
VICQAPRPYVFTHRPIHPSSLPPTNAQIPTFSHPLAQGAVRPRPWTYALARAGLTHSPTHPPLRHVLSCVLVSPACASPTQSRRLLQSVICKAPGVTHIRASNPPTHPPTHTPSHPSAHPPSLPTSQSRAQQAREPSARVHGRGRTLLQGPGRTDPPTNTQSPTHSPSRPGGRPPAPMDECARTRVQTHAQAVVQEPTAAQTHLARVPVDARARSLAEARTRTWRPPRGRGGSTQKRKGE